MAYYSDAQVTKSSQGYNAMSWRSKKSKQAKCGNIHIKMTNRKMYSYESRQASGLVK